MRLLAIASIFVSATALAGDYYVSPSGSNSRDGRSLDSAWKTLNHAVRNISAGDTLHVRGGVYSEALSIEISGKPGSPVTLQAYKDETPILDGGTTEVKRQTALLHIEDVQHIVVKGFEIRNLKTAEKKMTPIGVLVTGSANYIELRNNHVHSIETNYDKRMGGDAHGIAVLGYKKEPIHHVIIDGNEVSNLKLGSSEALVLNGNVKNFQVTGNKVHDCNNIAIDFIGFEKYCKDPAQDQARDGVCSGNQIYNIDSFGNPAYGKDRSAGGIYVDGGKNIVISHNVITNCNIGVELASEHKGRSTSHITVHNNLIYKNMIGGIFMGGYNKKRGLTEHCVIRNNTLYQNDLLDDGNGELYLQFGATKNTIKNNIFSATDQCLLIGNPFEENEANELSHNLFFCPDEPKWAMFQWKKQRYKGWQTWREAGVDRRSMFADPRFVDPEKNDFRLASDSPALNAGDPESTLSAGETDMAGAPRKAGSAIDLGAFEKQ